MGFSLLDKLRNVPLAFVDVETTGASAEFGDRVIELGIARVEGGRVVAEYQQLTDPGRGISPGITALTGISTAMVAGQPTFAQQLPAAMELLGGAVVLGHNVRFDLSFLAKEFRRAGTDLVQSLGQATVLDTVRIARRLFGRGGNGLQRLSARLGYQPGVAHRALADALTTAFVFEKMLEPLGGWDLSLCDAIREQGGPMGLLPNKPGENPLPLELEEALEQRRPVRMEYLDARSRRTHRIIDPIQVRRFNGELILIAFCQLRAERRNFKVERIVGLARIPDGIEAEVPPEAVDAILVESAPLELATRVEDYVIVPTDPLPPFADNEPDELHAPAENGQIEGTGSQVDPVGRADPVPPQHSGQL